MIKRFLSFAVHLLSKKKYPSSFQKYLDNGNLKIGKGCNLNQLQVDIERPENNFQNITVGDDCFLMGKIVLYSSKTKVKIGDRVFIGPDSTLFCYEDIEIGDDVMVSWGCTLITTNAHSLKSSERIKDVKDWIRGSEYKDWSVVESKKIVVEKKVWIGFNSIVTKGVRLAEGTIVASGSVVTKSTDPFVIVGGNPADFIKKTE